MGGNVELSKILGDWEKAGINMYKFFFLAALGFELGFTLARHELYCLSHSVSLYAIYSFRKNQTGCGSISLKSQH
jgi:hypothetical protein